MWKMYGHLLLFTYLLGVGSPAAAYKGTTGLVKKPDGGIASVLTVGVTPDSADRRKADVRYAFSSTAIPGKRGFVLYQNNMLLMHRFSVGITNNLSVTVGGEPFSSLNSLREGQRQNHFGLVSLKLSGRLAKGVFAGVSMGANSLAINTGRIVSNRENSGWISGKGMLTIGNEFSNFTASAALNWNGEVVRMAYGLSGALRLFREFPSISIVSENMASVGESAAQDGLSSLQLMNTACVRYGFQRLKVDFGLLALTFLKAAETGTFPGKWHLTIPLPYAGLSWAI